MKNRIIAVILTLSLILSSALILVNAEDVLLGDINSDGKVNAMDARLALRAAAQVDTLSDEQIVVADVNFDGKVNASDARLILRAAAQIETLPEMPTTETTTAETTTEEPTTDETTTEEPDTGVVVDEYPAVIDTFFSGNFYLECNLSDGEDEGSIKIASKGNSYEFSATFGDIGINIYYHRYTTYLKNPIKKTYTIYDKAAKDTLSSFLDGAELDFDEILGNFEFGEVKVTGSPVLTKGSFVDENDCDIYTFATENGSTAFYFVDDELRLIEKIDTEGEPTSVLLVSELSSQIPSDMLTTGGYKHIKDILSFLMSLIPTDLI